MAASARSFNPFTYVNKRKAKPTPTDRNTEETIMNDNVSPLHGSEAPGSKRADEKLSDAIHDAAASAADAAAGAAENVAGAAADAADSVHNAAKEAKAKVSKPGFFATRTGRIVKGAAFVAGGGLVALGGYAAYRAINAASNGAVGDALGEAAEATGEAVSDAAGELAAAFLGR